MGTKRKIRSLTHRVQELEAVIEELVDQVEDLLTQNPVLDQNPVQDTLPDRLLHLAISACGVNLDEASAALFFTSSPTISHRRQVLVAARTLADTGQMIVELRPEGGAFLCPTG